MRYIVLLCVFTLWHQPVVVSDVRSLVKITTETPQNYTTYVTRVSETPTMDNYFTRAVSSTRYKTFYNIRNTRRARHEAKNGKKKKNPKKTFRSLEHTDPCLRWAPTMNVSADPSFRKSITVDYCRSKSPPVPNTYTCVTNSQAELDLCILVESPHCRHVFENLTAGYYTAIVKPLCKRCFDVEVHNMECITPHYTRNISLEYPTDSTIAVGFPANVNIQVIIPTSCVGALLAAVVIYLVVKYAHHRKSLSYSDDNAVTIESLPGGFGHSALDSKTTNERLQNPQCLYQEQESSFMNIEEPTENEAMLSDCQRVSQEQSPIDSEEKSYIPSHVSVCPSLVTLNSNMAGFGRLSSCETLDSASVEVHDIGTTDQGSQTYPTDYTDQQTLQDYFNTNTGITNNLPARPFSMHKVIDIPYHLVFSSNVS